MGWTKDNVYEHDEVFKNKNEMYEFHYKLIMQTYRVSYEQARKYTFPQNEDSMNLFIYRYKTKTKTNTMVLSFAEWMV